MAHGVSRRSAPRCWSSSRARRASCSACQGCVFDTLTQDGSEISSLALSPNDAYLVTVARSLAVHIYALPDFSLVRSIPRAHDAPVALLSVDPTSSLVALGGTDGSVKVYDLVRGFVTHVFAGHGGVMSAL